MKMKNSLKVITLALAFSVMSTASLLAQQSTPQEKEQRSSSGGGVLNKIFGQDPKIKKNEQKNDQKKNESAKPSSTPGERLEPDDTNALPSDVSSDVQAGRRGQLSEEEAAVLPYYNNFLSTYRIGPEDVISVTVFGQERYSRAGIVVPPNAVVTYPLIPEGIFVGGKTTQQVAEELTKRLDEYIIEPKVYVSLDKAVSATYSVIGDVAQPGVRTMTRRYSITEALAMAGGVLETGDKSKVVILRQQADGNVKPIFVNVKQIERGRAKEMAFLVPGDQVVVPGNKLKILDKVMKMIPIISFARIFTGGW